MAQEKIEKSICNITDLPEEKIYEVFSYLNNEEKNNLALTNSMFGHSVFQNDRIKTKLSQYIATGHIDMAVKLLNLRPDLSKVMKNFLDKLYLDWLGLASRTRWK